MTMDEETGEEMFGSVRGGLVGALIALVLVGGCGGSAGDAGSSSAGADDVYAGAELTEPVAKPDVMLTEVRSGAAFHLREETEGFVTLLFIGYTHCPDVCPVHMGNLAAVMGDLPVRVTERLKVVFVSSDPARDTPQRIREWLSAFDPSFIGLRGSREEVRGLEEALGIAPSVVQEGDDYFVGHAAQVLAFGLDDTARVAYPWGTRQRDWLQDLPRLVDVVSDSTISPAGGN